jgi:hypothetical protein
MRRPVILACSLLTIAAFTVAPGCGSESDDPGGASGGASGGPCTGFACNDGGGSSGPPPGCRSDIDCRRVVCTATGVTTNLTGVVLDPAGRVPVFNAIVYVPSGPVPALAAGVDCNRCNAQITDPIAVATTDTSGAFTLRDVPIMDGLPLVIQIGKWRRQVKIATRAAECADTAVDAALTRLPRSQSEGDIPRIAVATGAADPLQCLLKKVGLEDSEFGVAGSPARVHLYAGAGFTDDKGSHVASSALAGGARFALAETLWGTKEELSKYDVVLLACEGNEHDTALHKPPAAKQALYDYAKLGGRVFTTHFHHVFFSTSPDPAPKGVATWTDKLGPVKAPNPPSTTSVDAEIVGTFPKAVAMKDWLGKQGALTNGKLPMFDARHNVDAVSAGGLNWIQTPNMNAAHLNQPAIQYMTFNAPIGASEDQICGRVVFSNLHVGAGTEAGGSLKDDPALPFPTSCQTRELSPQQKALEFMLFDLSSCIQKDDAPVQGPK